MAHGTHCHCMICTVGKKIGMINDEHHEEHDHDHDERENKCEHCHQPHKENGHYDCGCGEK